MSSRNLRQRLERLESRASVATVVLTMSDGSQRSIRADRKHWDALFQAWTARAQAEEDGQVSVGSPLDDELNAIREAINISESSGELFNLLRIMLLGPAETTDEEDLIKQSNV